MKNKYFGNDVRIFLVIFISSLFAACDKDKEMDFRMDGENTKVLTFDCGEAVHVLDLAPGKYAARTTSSCKDTLVLNGRKHAFDSLDLVFEVKEGENTSLLCKEGEGQCTLTYVRVDEELPARQRNYLPSSAIG